MENILDWPWGLMAPEFTILATATLLSLIDLFMPRQANRSFLPYLGMIGIAVAGFFVVCNIGVVDHIMNQMYRVDGFSNLFKLILLSGTLLIFILSLQTVNDKITRDRGEYYYLLLAAVLGAMMMASSADLITLFIGLETLSVSSYILVAIRKQHIQSNEAAFKYVVNGGISTAILLFGMSYIYGITGSTNLYDVMVSLQSNAFPQGFDNMVFVAFFFIFVGLSFKIASAPFHMWAPDVYQGAPTPITAFLSVVSKTAGFAIIVRIFLTGFGIVNFTNASGENTLFIYDIATYIGILAAATMVIGNVMALRQINVKRMMAYSSIAQAGYILVPLATASTLMMDHITFYLISYLFMNLGAFAILIAVTNDRGTDEIRAFAGLYHRSPFTAIAMTIFLLSLAGIPITAGFFGKLYIFFGSIWSNNYWLAGIMVAASVISYYYYFGIIRQMYMRAGDTEAKLRLPIPLIIVLVIGVIGTLAGGFFSDQVMEIIRNNFFSNNDDFLQIFDGIFN